MPKPLTKKLIIGLTGGIGSGKTAASDWFAAQGIEIVDTDVIAREVVAVGSAALGEIAKAFGSQILQPDGCLDRTALRQIVFNDAQARNQLERITHPRIQAAILQQLADATSPYVILVSALLLESQQHTQVSRILVIDVPESLQLARASHRDGQSADSIAKIIAAQISRRDRLARADDVIVNDGDLNKLQDALIALHLQYLDLAMCDAVNQHADFTSF